MSAGKLTGYMPQLPNVAHQCESRGAASCIERLGAIAFVLVVIATMMAVSVTAGLHATALVSGLFLSALGLVVLTDRLGN
jgi:hypothetical protein